MEDQVTSLEMSKELKEIGFKVETPFVWSEYLIDWNVHTREELEEEEFPYKDDEHYSAYTFQQLWEVLLVDMFQI